MIKVDRLKKTQVLWQAVFLAALPLATSGSAAKILFCVPTIPSATQATSSLNRLLKKSDTIPARTY